MKTKYRIELTYNSGRTEIYYAVDEVDRDQRVRAYEAISTIKDIKVTPVKARW